MVISKGYRIFAGAVLTLAFSAPVSIVVAQAAAAVLILSGLWLFLTGTPKDLFPFWRTSFLLIFLLILMLSSFFAQDFSKAVPQLRKSWVLLCFLPLAAFASKISVRIIIRVLVWGTVLASLIAIFRFLASGIERAAPYSGGYTTIALFEAAVLPFCFAIWGESRSKIRWAYLGAAGMMLLGLLLSGTRAGWFAAFVGIMIFGFFIFRKAILISFFAVILLILAIPQSRSIVANRFVSDKQGGFSSGRSALWRASSQPLSALPLLGYGPGSFAELVSDSLLTEIGDPGIKSWHSTPLEVLLESGPLALVSILGFAFITLVKSWRGYFREKVRKPHRLALFSSLVALYLASLTTNILRDFLLMSLLLILWTLIYSPKAELQENGG